jgi:hypothetical protein
MLIEANYTEALIFVSDTDITSGSIYSKPAMISMADQDVAEALVGHSFPVSTDYKATLNHYFHENCYLIADVIPIFFTASALWLSIGIAWALWTWVFRKRHTMVL